MLALVKRTQLSAIVPPGYTSLQVIFNKRFGSYRLVRKIAVGGMAEVFSALSEGPPPFARLVAIKAMLAHLNRDSRNVDMFYREARIGGLISHPNVIEVFDAEEIEGRHCMVMEFLDGQTADELVNRLTRDGATLPLNLALRIVSNAALGLHHIHELRSLDGIPLQLVHRDISPHNLQIGYDGQVKLFDFGVSVAGDNDQAQGQLAGKAAYMSPEQCRGRTVDRRSDVFSLGIVLHELLTMQRLFKRDNHISSIRAITEEPIPRPGQIIEGLSPEIDAIAMKALNRDADERFQTALDLHIALEASLSHLDVVSDRKQLSALMEDKFRNELSESQVVVQKILLAPAPSDASIDLSTFEHDAKTVVAQPQIFSEEGKGFEDIQAESEPTDDGSRNQAEDFFSARAEAALSKELKRARILNIFLVLLALGGIAFAVVSSLGTEEVTEPAAAAPDFLLVTVESSPPGASLYVAGREHPVLTPTMLMLPRQTTTQVELKLAGYQTETLIVDPAADDEETTRTISADLSVDPDSPDAPIGTIRLVYEPEDAIFYLDNELVAESSPAVIDGLTLNHEFSVRLQKAGFETLVIPLTLTSDEQLQLELELAEVLETAQLSVITTPAGANISINEEEVGQSPVEIDLPTNETYIINVSRAGYQPVRRHITHTRDRALNVRLQRPGAAAQPSPGGAQQGRQPAAPTRPTQAPAPADDDYPILLD